VVRTLFAMLAVFGALLVPASARAQFGGPPAGPLGVTAQSANVTIRLLSEAKAVAPGETFYVAIKQTIRPKWHTYWRNPGDTGEATRIDWTLPEGTTAGNILWPTPSAIRVGPLVNYGFSDQAVLPVAITVPANAVAGSVFSMRAAVQWLECEEVCIPAEGTVVLDLPVSAAGEPDIDAGKTISAAISASPQPHNGTATVSERATAQSAKPSGNLVVSIADPALARAKSAYFFPYSQSLIDHAGAQALRVGPKGLTLALPRTQSAKPLTDTPVEGVLRVTLPSGEKAFLVSATPGAILDGTNDQGVSAASGGLTLPLALAFALLGGLILNLMPCVFPVLSIKALSLAKAAHGDRRDARRDGLLFMAGVLVSFLALAGLLIALKAAGNEIGWGFQLQSPLVVIGLALLMFLVGLNLLGAFELGGSLQNIGSGLASKSGPVGAFFTGVLAVVVASPCTAPFMGGALGFAATQPPIAALSVFAALGLGFALPFTALAFAPGLLKALPKPGPWMDVFKQALAFPMFATAIWLVWVASEQIGAMGALVALGSMLAAGLVIWVFRVTKASEPLKRRGLRALVLTVMIGALAAGVSAVQGAEEPSRDQAKTASATPSAIPSEPWSPARVQALQAEGKPVFVDFTAAWCVTCKVNETVVMSQAAVQKAFADTGTVFLVADWTSRDATIARELAAHGRAGVPLYLVYPRSGGEPVVLPQVLTPDRVIEALAHAAKG